MNRPPAHFALYRLRAHLRRGGIVAYPTESSYGLGCLPTHPRALIIRQRPQQWRELRPICGDADQPFALRPFFEPDYFLQGTRMRGQTA